MNKTVAIELQDNFALLISSLSSARDIRRFFTTFLTEEEKTMLTKRLMLHLMLEKRYEPAEIATVLSISRETVYKHKMIWQKGDVTYRGIIAKIAQRTKMKAVWRTIERLLQPLSLVMQARNSMRARAKFTQADY